MDMQSTDIKNETDKVCIVGAGSSGLAAAKTFAERGIPSFAGRPLDARLATGTAVMLAEGQQQSLAFAPRADGAAPHGERVLALGAWYLDCAARSARIRTGE